MAGLMALVRSDDDGASSMARTERWEVQYARFFSYVVPSSRSSALSPLPKNRFKGAWLSTSSSAAAGASFGATLSLFVDRSSSSRSILTVSFQDRTLEEHFVCNLQFSRPQLTCMAGDRGSRVAFVHYKDGDNETHKFGLRFSTYNDANSFIHYLEDILSCQLDSPDVRTEISSQPQLLNQIRGMETSPVNASTGSSEILETSPICSEAPIQSVVKLPQSYSSNTTNQIDLNGYVPVVPPRFTSLVSNCSSVPVQGELDRVSPHRPEDLDLKSQIARYMQDASFLDILTKVEEVIAEFGGDLTTMRSFV